LLSEASGLHWTYDSSVERGERNISLLNILKLAEALEVDPADLIRGLIP
jgi:transcriptional regulator with XRE-family HTH domain